VNVCTAVYDSSVRVLIADDHRLIVEGVKRSLGESDDFEVVGECSSGSQVLPMVGRTNPDVVLLDLRMPGTDGLTCLAQIKKRYPEVKVVILSVTTDEKVIQTVLQRGASAFIVKSINPVDLPSALRQAVEGTVYSAIGLPDPGDSAARAAGLTDRETTILTALARGLSNEAIGKELWVAEQTVKFHLTNIYRKLGVSNRTEAARLAYQNGLVESPLDDH
jgi:DNA-binding NarL/FixJ family response regulator